MSAEGDEGPITFIKKRKGPKKNATRTSSSSKLSFGGEDEDQVDQSRVAGGEEEGDTVVIKKSSNSGRNQKKKNVVSTSSLRLSTEGDEQDQDEQQSLPTVIKRSTGNTVKKGLGRPSNLATTSTSSLSIPTTPSTSIPSSTSTNYSKEYLEQLKKSQNTKTKVGQEEGSEARGGEGYDELAMSKFGRGGGGMTFDGEVDTLQDSNSESIIPSSSMISQAKSRREALRKIGGSGQTSNNEDDGDGFVSLQVGQYDGGVKGGDSRLVREEDETGDGDEDLAQYTGSEDKVPLGRSANKLAAMKMRNEMGDLIEEVEMDVEEEDEEMKRWEEEQIRRGDQRRRGGDETMRGEDGKKKGYRPAPIPHASTLPSLSAVTSRLSTALSTLTSSHSLDRSSLDHFTHERQELDQQERELRIEVEKVEEKSRWFADFKEMVEVWAQFLDEKYPELEKIESSYLAIQRERYEIVARRRFADDSDDVSLFTGVAINDDLSRIGRRGVGEEEEEKDEELERLRKNGLEPRSIVRNTRRAERERRYLERTTRTNSTGQPQQDQSEESDAGYFTDSDLSHGDSSDLSIALTDLTVRLNDLFSDVKSDEFRDPNLTIRRKFEEWRSRFREEYDLTFAGLAMVGVWEFWARVEMVRWNPFEIAQLPPTPSDLSQYSWHQALTSYGHHQSPSDDRMDQDEEEDLSNDESEQVVNLLVTSTVIPRLEQIARESYDPLSLNQTKAAVRLVDEVSYCVEKSSPKFESLVQAFLSQLRHHITLLQRLILPHTSQLTIPSLAFDPTTFEARTRFLNRGLKLVESCQRWRRFMKSLRIPIHYNPNNFTDKDDQEVEGEGEGIAAGESFDVLIQRELVGLTLLPVIEAAWGTGGEEISNKILLALPKEIPPALKRKLEGEGMIHA